MPVKVVKSNFAFILLIIVLIRTRIERIIVDEHRLVIWLVFWNLSCLSYVFVLNKLTVECIFSLTDNKFIIILF